MEDGLLGAVALVAVHLYKRCDGRKSRKYNDESSDEFYHDEHGYL